MSYKDNKKMLPVTDQKPRKGKATHCQKLARNLERFDENPAVWMKELPVHLTPVEKLPAELLQNILYLVLDEDEMSIRRPNTTTRDLALVCTKFRDHLPAVNNMWDKRAGEVNEVFRDEKISMKALINDMMAPLQVASAALNNQYVKPHHQIPLYPY